MSYPDFGFQLCCLIFADELFVFPHENNVSDYIHSRKFEQLLLLQMQQ